MLPGDAGGGSAPSRAGPRPARKCIRRWRGPGAECPARRRPIAISSASSLGDVCQIRALPSRGSNACRYNIGPDRPCAGAIEAAMSAPIPPAAASSDAPSLKFTDLGLPETLLRALSDVGYESPSPIQAATIPPLLAGRDVLGQAQTGTGKTAAFALPILARIDPSQ